MRNIVLTAALASLAASPVQAESKRDIASTAIASKSLQTLTAALKAADLVETLKGKGPYTVFAPTDAAFAKLPKATLKSLLQPAQRETLRRILLNHVVAGKVGSIDALRAGKARSLAGETFNIRLADGRLRVGDAVVSANDLTATNGVIHVIDTVLIPPTPKTERQKLVGLFTTAIDRGVPLFNGGNAAACTAVYEIAVRAALDLSGDQLSAQERKGLENALRSLPETSSEKGRSWVLRNAMDEAMRQVAKPRQPLMRKQASKLQRVSSIKSTASSKKTSTKSTWKPIREAKLPAGFPDLGPVGEVVEKRYPAYRSARAKGGNSFWTLFSHIKRNKISMTAPVEMSMTDGENGRKLSATNMAFLYGDRNLGKAGRQGKVDVIDVAPMRVLSIGIRGRQSAQAVEAAKKQIEARLQRDGIERTGPWRLLGYNSPMVPNKNRFWELQAPIGG